MANNPLKNVINGVQNQATRWFHHITKAADDYKNRQESRRSELHPASNIPPSINAEPDDKSKDSVEGSGTEGLTNVGDSTGETSNESPSRHLQDHQGSPKNIQKEASPAPDFTSSELPSAQSPDKSGDGKLMVGSKVGRSVSASPSAPRRIKQGEFLKVTESSPLVEPSEVVVVTRDVQFAQSVLSPYEELKRADLAVQNALEEKMRLAAKHFNIPVENQLSSGNSTGSTDIAVDPIPKDAKEMIIACIKNVDKLVGIVNTQKVTKENMDALKEQQKVHSNLNALLTQIMGEYERKEEELELRRQELHRIREQNHGYQERLQLKTATKRVPSPTAGGLSSPTLSPPHSRPNSYLSSSSDPHHEEEQEVVTKTPLKPQLSDPVATSSSNLTNFTPATKDNTNDSSILPERLESQLPSRDLAQDEFADAAGNVRFTSTDDLTNGVETNRESTETEVVMSTTDSSSNSSSETIIVDTSISEIQEIGKEKNGTDVPELGDGIINGHSSHGESTISSGDENCNQEVSSATIAIVVDSSSTKNIVVAPEDLKVDKQSNNGNENS